MDKVKRVFECGTLPYMGQEYDLFEKFPDGSSLWRACVLGLEGTRIHMRELAQKSKNRFYAIDLGNGKIVDLDFANDGMRLSGLHKAGRRSRSAAA